MAEKKMKALLIVLLFTLSQFATGQSYTIVSGQVLDHQTGGVLPFCSVFVKGAVIGTVANVEGKFKLNIPEALKSDTLVVSHVGYKNYYALVEDLPKVINVRLREAPIDLKAVNVETDRLTASEIFQKAIEKINLREGYPGKDFRMDGFFREVHASNGERTGALECAISVFADDVRKKYKDISINQFRKIYDRKQNTDQFIGTKEGHNHLLLLLNGGINLIPLARRYKTTVWQLPLEIKELTYYNDRMVYVLTNEKQGRILRLYVDVADYTVYKNELIIKVQEEDHENYAWRKMNSRGEECGAVYDHQGYEYRKINGKLFPYYSFRRFDFRCYDLNTSEISATAKLSKELLINQVVFDPVLTSTDKLRKKQGLMNRKEPYDSAFWKHFNDIQDVDPKGTLLQGNLPALTSNPRSGFIEQPKNGDAQLLKIGDHVSHKFTRADSLYGTLSPDLSCYDVKHYGLDLEIDPERELIAGEVTMSFEVLKATREIRLDLLEFMTIDEIHMGGQSLNFRRDLDAVYIAFDEGLMSRGIYAVTVKYHGHPLEPNFGETWAGGFMWSKDSEGNDFAQTLCQGYGAKGWFPVKNHLSDEPDSVDIKVTVPSKLVAVANGQLVKKKQLANTSQYHWKTTNPINTYDIAVHIGTYERMSNTFITSDGEELDLQYFFLPQDKELILKNIQMAPKMLEVYERYFGPYPFQEDGFKLVQSPYPMEHQSCVAVGPYFDEFLILHETAHEWWGNNVSIDDNADIWINEAFATYAESLYVEATLGYEMGQRYLNSRKAEILNDHPLVGVRNVNHFHYHIEDKYTKGSLMLNTLRHMVNDDERWFETLAAVQTDFRQGFIDTETLTSFLELQLEIDLSSFFEQYLLTTRIPILAMKKNPTSWSCRWANTVEGFHMPLRLDDQVVEITTDWQEVAIDMGENNMARLKEAYLIRVKSVEE